MPMMGRESHLYIDDMGRFLYYILLSRVFCDLFRLNSYCTLCSFLPLFSRRRCCSWYLCKVHM